MSIPIARAVTDPTDADLMARVRRGDEEAFAALVDRHKDPLVAYLARLTGSLDRAEDLAQETFLRLYRSASRYRERGYLAAFLYRIGTNLVRSEARRERRWRDLVGGLAGSPMESRETVEPVGPRRLVAGELRARLAAAVVALPLGLRVPLVLYEIEDWSQGEIARVLGCRVGTVKSRLHRARARLRRDLAADWDGWKEGMP